MGLTNVDLWPQFAELALKFGEGVHRVQGVRVVTSEHPSAGGQGLLEQLAGALEVAEIAACLGKTVHRGQGVRVVVAEHAPVAGQSLLVQLTGTLEVPECPPRYGDTVQ